MVNQVFNLIARVFGSCVVWFESIFTSSGFSSVLLAGIFFLLLKRYILDPLFRGAGSDQVKKRNKEN